ncbi:MAG: hypothetical protein FJX68_19110 [Alphaproteobacteria bacterium]|nr:hypothetical protein [Alphaproteobacteria bacterium]
MNAAEALRKAWTAGIEIRVEGRDLALEAQAPPPAEILESLAQHKQDIVALLLAELRELPADGDRAATDAFEERAAILEYDAGLPRTEAERATVVEVAHECAIVRWLAANPPPVADPNTCAHCRQPETRDAALLPFLAGDDTHRWVHRRCWPDWHRARRLAAERALAAAGADTGPRSAA